MKLSKLSAAILVATASSVVFAENTSLDQIIVTANNTEQSARSVTSNMTIITAEDIEKKQYQTLADALRTVPGIMLKGSGGLGKSTSIYMRGDTQAHILILQDGIDLTDAAGLGGANIENLQLSDVERIEIIKGSQSGVWGANATAGVINIITKKGGHQASVNVEIGSNNTRKISTTLGDSNKQGDFVVNFSTLNTDGFSAVREANVSHENFEDDGFKQTNISLKFGINVAENHRIETFIKTSSGNNEYDDTTNPDTTARTSSYEQDVRQIQYKYNNQKLNARIYLSDNTVDRVYPSATYPSEFHGTVNEMGGQLGYQYRQNDALNILVNLKEYHNNSTTSYGGHTVNGYKNTGVALTNTNHITTRLTLTESLRYDEFDKFENATTGKIGLKNNFTDNVFISANYGTAYNAPTLSQLAQPNPVDLIPEKTHSYDLTFGAYDFALTYFNTETKNRIDWRYDSYLYYVNTPQKILTDGVETSYRSSLEAINTDLGFNFTWLSARNENGDTLAYRPEHTANLSLDYYGLSKTHIGLETRYVGRQYSSDNNAGVQLGEYFLTDIKADYEVSKTLTFYAKVINLMDDKYTDNVANATGSTANYVYSNGGRQFFIGLRGQL
jgi:vitamin B12 transporter